MLARRIYASESKKGQYGEISAPTKWTSQFELFPPYTTPAKSKFGGGVFIEFFIVRRIHIFLAVFAGLPRSRMSTLIMWITQTESLMLILTSPTTLKRCIGCVAANPLLATRRLNQWGRLVTTKATMFSRDGLCLHSIVGHSRFDNQQVFVGL